jgi:hypothetical protein
VIYYRRLTSLDHIEAPAELVGFVDLSGTELALCHSFGDYHVVGICDPILWIPPADDDAWVDGPDGWQVFVDDRAPHAGIAVRANAWCHCLLVEGADGKPWAAPSILSASGARAFPVRYSGRQFLPTPTEEQAKAIAIATEARTLLDGSRPSIDSDVLMPWAAWLLTLMSHLSVETIAAVGVLDDRLALRIVRAAAGLDFRLDEDGPG